MHIYGDNVDSHIVRGFGVVYAIEKSYINDVLTSYISGNTYKRQSKIITQNHPHEKFSECHSLINIIMRTLSVYLFFLFFCKIYLGVQRSVFKTLRPEVPKIVW